MPDYGYSIGVVKDATINNAVDAVIIAGTDMAGEALGAGFKSLKGTLKPGPAGAAGKAAEKIVEGSGRAATEAGSAGANAATTFVERNGFRFSEAYYKHLWATGRKAPSLVAKEILEGTGGKGIADATKAGFFKYVYGGWEMVYNPVTREVWHLQPTK
jgi:filamentous hemagglutinin